MPGPALAPPHRGSRRSAGYTLRINNRRCSKEQTPGIHSSVDAPPQRPSRTLQSVTSLHGNISSSSSRSRARGQRSVPARRTCNQPATAGQFVIATQAAAPPAGGSATSDNPLEMHRQTGKVGKVREPCVTNGEHRSASSWKTKGRTEGGRGRLAASRQVCDEVTMIHGRRPSCRPPVTVILNRRLRTRRVSCEQSEQRLNRPPPPRTAHTGDDIRASVSAVFNVSASDTHHQTNSSHRDDQPASTPLINQRPTVRHPRQQINTIIVY